MTDTAQARGPAETVVAPDPFMDAANAFAAAIGQPARELPPRSDDGRFAKQQIEAPEEAEPEPVAESQEAEDVTEEAADEAQPEDVALPTSWPAEHAETWQTLPAEARAVIADREAQRDAAVNAKFQEAANVRKANEAIITEANANREKYLKDAEMVLSLVQLERPYPEQFGAGTGQYNREAYDLAVSRFEQANQIVQQVQQQRDSALAQHRTELETQEKAAFEEVEAKYRPALLKAVPDIASPEKQVGVIREIAQYAIENGVPESVFSDPKMAQRITSPELLMAWKAMQYDRIQSAKAKAGETRPEPRKAQPAVRPGVATPRSAVAQAQYTKDKERLAQSGSIEDGAAIWKRFM